MVRLPGYGERRIDQLSGGQKQRVALARAVVLEPEVLLLDEPMAALDLKLRKEMQVEVKNLQERLKITFVFVTHDQDEALIMSDRIAVMNQGRIEQLGTPEALYERPRTRFVADFLAVKNILEATVVAVAGGPGRAATRGGTALVAAGRRGLRGRGDASSWGSGPERLSLAGPEGDATAPNAFQGTPRRRDLPRRPDRLAGAPGRRAVLSVAEGAVHGPPPQAGRRGARSRFPPEAVLRLEDPSAAPVNTRRQALLLARSPARSPSSSSSCCPRS